MIELNDQSRQFASALFQAFPAWREFQLAHDTETFSLPTAGRLIVKIPSPISGRWLLIDTCDDEITVTYSAYHTHFDLESRSCEAAAIDFLRAFTLEEIVIAIGMHNNKVCGSDAIAAHEALPVSNFAQPIDRICVRSWKGTFDREIEVAIYD